MVGGKAQTCPVAARDESPDPAQDAPGGEPRPPRARMPRWLPRALFLALALVACYQFAHWVFDRLVGLLVNVLISFFCALAIEPAVVVIWPIVCQI